TKQPQRPDTDDQPHGEVEPEVFAARETRGGERPQAPCARDEAGAVSLEPAPSEREAHHPGDGESPRQARLTHVALEPRQITAEPVAERADNAGPNHCAAREIGRGAGRE